MRTIIRKLSRLREIIGQFSIKNHVIIPEKQGNTRAVIREGGRTVGSGRREEDWNKKEKY